MESNTKHYKLTKDVDFELSELNKETLVENVPTIICGFGSICLYGLGLSLNPDVSFLAPLIYGSANTLLACTGLSGLVINSTKIAKSRREQIKSLKDEKNAILKRYEIMESNIRKTK